jgi:hypothetical protein
VNQENDQAGREAIALKGSRPITEAASARQGGNHQAPLSFGSEGQAGENILMAELGEIQQQLCFCGAGCHGAEDITDREPGTPDTWFTKAHGWVDRDAFKQVHIPKLGTAGPVWQKD